MQRYKNLSGNSGISAYQIGGRSIVIQFTDGGIYEYGESNPGFSSVEDMKRLAEVGQGLATYINTHVRENYERKIV